MRIGLTGQMVGAALPYDEELEYLESNGHQYIDLGVTIATDVGFDVKAAIVTTISNGCVFGQTNTFNWSSSNPGYALVNSGSNVYFRYGTGTDAVIGMTGITLSTPFTAKRDGSDFYVNGSLVGSKDSPSEWGGSVEAMHIFHRSPSGHSTYSAARMYSLAFGKVFDLIPVLKDGIPCLYDKLSEGFFYNQNSGYNFGYKKKDGTIVSPT